MEGKKPTAMHYTLSPFPTSNTPLKNSRPTGNLPTHFVFVRNVARSGFSPAFRNERVNSFAPIVPPAISNATYRALRCYCGNNCTAQIHESIILCPTLPRNEVLSWRGPRPARLGPAAGRSARARGTTRPCLTRNRPPPSKNSTVSDHKPTTYRHTYWPHTDHAPTTYRPRTDHIPTIYRSLLTTTDPQINLFTIAGKDTRNCTCIRFVVWGAVAV